MPTFTIRIELNWSHYSALMRVKNSNAGEFYENEAVMYGWNKVQLERQIQTSYYEHIIGAYSAESDLQAESAKIMVMENKLK